MDLIYDIDLILTSLWCKAYLLYQGPDIIDRVIAGGIQLMDIHGGTVIERHTGMTAVTGFTIGLQVLAIDSFSQDTGTGGLTYTPGTAEQEGMGQVVVLDGILEGGGDMLLSYNGIKGLRTIFSG